MKIGYARVSTQDQNLDLQIDALTKAGCEEIFTDVASGSKAKRDGLEDAFRHLRKGDTLIVWKLDRLGRSLQHLIEFIGKLQDKGVYFKVLEGEIDTTTTNGRLIFHIFAALAEFEKELIRERTKAGLEAARSRGRYGGRPKKADDKKREMILALYYGKKHEVQDICDSYDISRTTLYRYVNEDKQKKEAEAEKDKKGDE